MRPLIHRAADIEEIKRLNAAAGYHFFEPGEMRFFRSRIAPMVWLSADGELAFFVTSEQFEASDGYRAPRTYSVRVCEMATGRIGTVGGFQAHKTLKAAERAAQREAGI